MGSLCCAGGYCQVFNGVARVRIVLKFNIVEKGLRLCGWTEMTGCLLVVQGGQYLVLHFRSLGDNFHAPLFVFERERERTFFFLFILLVVTQMVIICISAFCSGGNRSGMLMLTIPLIRSDPHSDKGNTCRLAIQRLQFNVKRNKAQACKEKNLHYTTRKHHLRYSRGNNNNKYRHHSLFIFIFVMLGMSCQRSQSARARDISSGAPSGPADTLYSTCLSLVHMGKMLTNHI